MPDVILPAINFNIKNNNGTISGSSLKLSYKFMFRIIFVLDILDGQVVHAVRGERKKYRPIHNFSKVCSSSNPMDIVHELAPVEVYIADLNRLEGRGNNDEIIRQVGWETSSMLDLGAATMEDVHHGRELADSVVLCTEKANESLISSATGFYPRSINMSIDIKNERVLTGEPAFDIPPIKLIQRLNSYDIKDLIILELDRVGTSSGFNTDFLEQVMEISDHDILLGGGIRGMEDIDLLKDIGLSGVLVATSVHNRAILAEMIQVVY